MFRHSDKNSYTAGFVLSIILTLVPFWIVSQEKLNGWGLVLWLMAFAAAQLYVQLVFFLHLGREKSPKWNLVAFIFAMFFTLFLVIGSIWIMYNLDYNMHPDKRTPQEIEQILLEDENYNR